MTALSEKVAAVDRIVMDLKKRWVSEEHDQTDLLIYVHLYRGDDLVCTLQCPLDRDTALDACFVACMGMCVETVVLTFESWHSTHQLCPATGEEWKPGEMAFLGQTSAEAREKGWVLECLTTVAADREKHAAMISRPYVITGTEVEFAEPQVGDNAETGTTGGGYLWDQLVYIMSQPTALDRMAHDEAPQGEIMRQLADGLGDEAAMFHLDCASLRALSERDLIEAAVLMAEDGSQRMQMIKERFGDSE